MDYKLTPSDLTYACEDCRHCCALKVKQDVQRPSIGLPQVFSRIGALQNAYYPGLLSLPMGR